VSASSKPNPLDAGRRRRGPECVSDLVLDQLTLGELGDAERAAAAGHVAGCTDCATASARLIEDRAIFAREAVIPNLAADAVMRAERTPRSRFWRWLPAPLALAAAGIAALVTFATPPAGFRPKGEFSLSPYVLHPESATAGVLHQGEPLHPGDRLQFRYNGGKAGHLTIVSVDATGEVSVYYPPGPMAAPVEAGNDIALSSAVELDTTLGREVIVGVRCERPTAVDEIVAATRKAVGAARARGVDTTALGPLGLPCAETRHQIAKQPPPLR
jgi:hypothetical protein